MILLTDPIPTLAVDLRQLHPDLGRPLFEQALRGARLLHTLGGAWEAYRAGRLLGREATLVARALETHLAPVAEHGRLACLAFAHRAHGPEMTTVILTAQTPQEERAVLEGFWRHARAVLGSGRDHQLISYGGARWGHAFLLRRTVLHDLAPAGRLPTGRPPRHWHFDVEDVLSGGDRWRVQPLELAALRYQLPGPWSDPADEAGADTAQAIREALARGDRARAQALAQARLLAIWSLYQRLAGPFAET